MNKTKYIYQNADWPDFYWDKNKISSLLAGIQHNKGLFLGKMQAIGMDLQENANMETITEDVVKSAEIEGEILNTQEVRSSIARRLGIYIDGSIKSKRNVDGIVDITIDVTSNYAKPLTKERLLGWQNALFPGGYSGIYKIAVGKFRDDSNGPMQVVSGAFGKEKVHYQAPDADKLEQEMAKFLNWINKENNEELVLKAAIAHLWFLTLHLFDDGNGRVARTVTDMLLARADGISKRFYSVSAQIQKDKKEYYYILEKIQKGSLDITDWLIWFLNCLDKSIELSEQTLNKILYKHYFLQKASGYKLNDRQKKIIDIVFNSFKGNLTSSKWAKLTKVSHDTATRDIAELLKYKLLVKKGDGRSTHYVFAEIKKR